MNIAIIGAGATGLAATLDLLKAGHAVTIFEATEKPGGLATGFKEPNWNWSLERFYHHWFASDADVFRIADEIGMRDKIIFRSPRTVGYHNGAFHPVFSPKDAMLYPGVSFLAKIPWGLSAIFLKLTSNWQALENVTTHEWCSKWMGAGAYAGLVQPMLEGKFGAYARDVNMAWMWARVKARSFSLGTFEGGFQAYFDALAKHVQSKGATLHYKTPVKKIEQSANKGISIQLANGSAHSFDRALVTTSPRLMTQLTPSLPANYLGALNNLKSLGAVVAVFALNQPLGTNRDYYWYNMPKAAGFPFLCLCEHTNFAKPEDFGGEHIVYAGDYVAQDDPILSEPEDAIARRYQAAFTRINPAFNPSWVRKSWVFRESYAQPVPFIGHSKNIPATHTPIDGLYFASMSHVYPWDRGTNYALELGRKVAAEMG